MKRKIILEDGSEFLGEGFGSESDKTVELVFNTSMVGYQEIISDPSYTGQAVVMTYPLIGNYGINEDDNETRHPSISGLIVRQYCDEPSNFRCSETLSQTMKRYDIAGISGIDTRKLTRHIRDYGSCKACIVSEDTDTQSALEKLKSTDLDMDVVSKVSTDRTYSAGMIDNASRHIVAIDCGMKRNILRELSARGCRITVVPFNTSAETILDISPDGIFVSN